ncbi:MAG: hypothetical protein KME06_03965 [Kastovskya adunca ATA6-11-RM4]|jgi:hypothetical protein|nr:hypothetical protein [Kastovskya adunca ATA6-11-RM4]
MGVNKKVFASLSEQDNFYKLKKTWEVEEGYRVYHNLPFLMVFNTNEVVDISNDMAVVTAMMEGIRTSTLQFTDIEQSRLKKTSVDYTLCNEADEPLICIDFDGLGQGYNLGSQYSSKRKVSFWRKEITELKLRVAHGSLFPYFVVGSRYFKDIGEDLKLTIIDGIIGAVLSQIKFDRRFHESPFPEGAGWSQEDYENLSSQEQYEIFKRWAIDLEVDTELDNNPIVREIIRLSWKVDAWSHSIHHMCLPSLGIQEKVLLGAKVTIHSKAFGDIEEQAYLPNFKVPRFSAGCLAEQIARLLALDKLKVLSENI